MNRYYTFCSLDEVAQSRILRFAFGALLFAYFAVFNSWLYSSLTTYTTYQAGEHVCRPYFQSCDFFYFLTTLPDGYSQPLFYMVLAAGLVASVYFAVTKQWVYAQLSVLPSFVWHGLVIFFASQTLGGNYDYYLFYLALVLLFFPHKEFFLKLSLVMFYVLSSVSKIHETWIVGTYFSALKTGLPLFPDWSIPLWSNLVIFMEMVGAWFLMSRNALLQRASFVFFVAFHLYSGLLVGMRYPATVLPSLFVLFGPWYSFTKPPFDARSLPGWLLAVFLIAAQATPLVIYGDEKLTGEGNRYGFYMFEANHQCVSSGTVQYQSGAAKTFRIESISSRDRCDPYSFWFKLHTRCERAEISAIPWTFDHSINGGPFLRIVDVPDACALSYHPFAHNEWIKTESESPAIVGYPVENIYD